MCAEILFIVYTLKKKKKKNTKSCYTFFVACFHMREIMFSKNHFSWSGIVCPIHMICNYYNLLKSGHFKLWIIYPKNWCLIYVWCDKTKINRCLCRNTHLFRDCRDLWWYVLFHSPLINVHLNVLFLHINFCHSLFNLAYIYIQLIIIH